MKNGLIFEMFLKQNQPEGFSAAMKTRSTSEWHKERCHNLLEPEQQIIQAVKVCGYKLKAGIRRRLSDYVLKNFFFSEILP